MGKKTQKKAIKPKNARPETLPNERIGNTRADRIFDWFRNHRLFSLVVVMLTGISLLSSAYQLFDFIRTDIKENQVPRLELQFVEENRFTDRLEVVPYWTNTAKSGFSEPLAVCRSETLYIPFPW
jgi:hypothetical protein